MKMLVTGSAGHLGEGIMRAFRAAETDVTGFDTLASPFTDVVASITDRTQVRNRMQGVDVVIHTATLHKPHLATHTKQEFVDVNVSGTLNLLEEAVAANVGIFIFTSTTSVFGHASRPRADEPAVWVTESLAPIPRNVYGVTKVAAEALCELFHRQYGLACLVLRTSRFFPEEDDDRVMREAYDDQNLKVNEFLHRRIDLEDAVDAHRLAVERAPTLGFGRYIISATTPFTQDDMAALRSDAPSVVKRYFPYYEDEYARRYWRMFDSMDRVYVNAGAREDLGWHPRHHFASLLRQLREGQAPGSRLAREVGSKGYHAHAFKDGPYPVE